jgi:Protein of unknown function (DUF 659)
LTNKIQEVIEEVGQEKFAAIVSDNASAIAAARQKISELYPHIINIRCIAHFVNLISKDILGKYNNIINNCNLLFMILLILQIFQYKNFNIFIFNNLIIYFLEHSLPKRILNYCNILSRFFKTSHQGADLLHKYIKDMDISGGSLKTYCETRWTSSYETISSVVRLQMPLEKVN